MVELVRKTPSIVFDWREWINHFTTQITNLDIPCVFNAEVFDIIKENNRVVGIKYKTKKENPKKSTGKQFSCAMGTNPLSGENSIQITV